MAWNKPKKTITNVIVGISLTSLFISILAITTFILWLNNPKFIHSIGEEIPAVYVKEIQDLYKQAKNEKDINKQYKYYKKLSLALDGISSLDRYYVIKQKVYKFLIHYYRSKNDHKNALIISKTWMEQNDYDFDAKRYYADTLAKVSIKEANKYYQTLYNQHKEIPELTKQYIQFLVDSKEVKKALTVENEFNRNNTLAISPKFKLYYLNTDNSKYTNEYSTYINQVKYLDKNTFELRLSKNFNFLSALRFDIDNIHTGTTIESIDIEISTKDKIYSHLQVKPINHLKKINTDSYTTLGIDPFFYIELPEEVKKNKHEISLKIQLKLKYEMQIVQQAIKNLDTGNK